MLLIRIHLLPLLMGALLLTGLLGCKQEQVGNPPSISYVRVVAQDSTITSSLPRNYIAIIGQDLATVQEVFINDYEAYFNPTLVTNTSIILSLPAESPWRDVPNRIRVVTTFGSAETPFSIIQPPPVITDFTPKAAGPGAVITITGSLFDNLLGVTFDEVAANVVSFTSTEIRVEVPEGVAQAFIHVTTPGGTVVSENAFGFAWLLYGDSFPTDFWEGHWGGDANVNSTEVFRGTQAMKFVYNDAWGGFQIGANTPVDISGYTAIKVSVYGGAGSSGKAVKVVLSDNWDNGFVANLTEGAWTDYTIPIESLGGAATLSTLIIQAQDFTPGTAVYIDDVGFI